MYERMHFSSDEAGFMRMMRKIIPGPQTTEEEIKDVREAKAGLAEARDRLVAANAEVIILEARRYSGKGALYYAQSIENHDLLQEGVLGFYKAIPPYEEEWGVRLGQYARFRVRDFISTAVNQAQVFSSPGRHVVRRTAVLGKRQRELTRKFDREPTQAEFLRSFGSKVKMDSVARFEQFLKTDRTTKDDYDVVPEEERLRPDELLAFQQQAKLFILLEAARHELTQQERFIIEHRYCDKDSEMTQPEIGKVYGVSGSQICHIETRAKKILGDYLESHAGSFEDYFVGFRDA